MPKKVKFVDNRAVKLWGSLVGPLANNPGMPSGMSMLPPIPPLLTDEIFDEVDETVELKK